MVPNFHTLLTLLEVVVGIKKKKSNPQTGVISGIGILTQLTSPQTRLNPLVLKINKLASVYVYTVYRQFLCKNTHGMHTLISRY